MLVNKSLTLKIKWKGKKIHRRRIRKDMKLNYNNYFNSYCIKHGLQLFNVYLDIV